MKLTRALRHYTSWFHMLGLSCYPAFGEFSAKDGTCRRVHKSLNYMPSAVLLLLTAVLTIIKCVITFHGDSFSSTGSVIVAGGLVSYVSTVFIAVGQSLLHSSQFAMLFTQINAVERSSRKNYNFNFYAFRRRYLQQVIVNFAHFVPPVVTFLASSSSNTNYFIVTAFFTLRILTLLPVFHVLFYVDLLDQMLKTFGRYVEMQATTALTEMVDNLRGCRSKFAKNELKHYKLLHFKMWEVAQTMNSIFGWTLTAILLQYFISALYNVYFTLAKLGDEPNVVDVLRKLTFSLRFVVKSPESVYLINRIVISGNP